MRVSKEQVAQHRQALIDATRRLVRARGFEGAGVAEICKEAGLTHGAFYRHFPSKQALMLEASAEAFEWTPQHLDGQYPLAAGAAATVAKYLSVQHRDCELGCPVAALAVDAARAGGEIAEVFSKGIDRYIERFADELRKESPSGSQSTSELEAQALHLLCTMVGGMVIARATADARPRLSTKVLGTLRKRLVGWVSARAET